MDDKCWRVWWTGSRGVIQSIAGEFERREECDRCIKQLSKLYPNAAFRVEYTGRTIGHIATNYPKQERA